jgi:very-short-patch-repair endonuclease
MPPVITRAEALGAGLTRDQIRQRVRSGRWCPLGHGVYARGTDDSTGDEFAAARQDHASRTQAAVLVFSRASAALHSAAVLHGLPLWRPLPQDVALNVSWGAWNGRRAGVVLHRMTMEGDDVIDDRVPLTSIARTCIDLARLSSTSDGLTSSDAALREGRVTHEALASVAERTRDARGRRRGAVVAREASGLRESPAESASWAYFLKHRLPLPVCQFVVSEASGAFIARVDFWWERARLVGECDGRMKYRTPEDLYAEKRREDAIRATGRSVLRWGPQDLRTGTLAQRLRRFLT